MQQPTQYVLCLLQLLGNTRMLTRMLHDQGLCASAAGRTSRNVAGPVDLYAEATAAAWQAEGGPALAAAPGAPPGPIPRSAPNQNSALQPSRSDTGPSGAGGSSATEQTLPYRPVPQAPRSAAHARLTQARPPFTPPHQSHQQVQAAALQPSHQAAAAHARSDVGDGAARLQSALDGGRSTGMTPRGSESAAQHSNQLSGQFALPSATLLGTGAAHRSPAAPDHHLQLSRSR